ncbi:hypothetical protein [Deinococcus budaensis]|uniref:Uncharacterized protein n=1 Tax=Deinococcus budaensis TaxID=1665626 RepID=A0A7W8LPU0_9DEIO|nr:hypothetical protein [Deinococcus budaensis]MBB5234123.1 hypothetical protein [Deinococcus budaensis]
MIGFPAGHTAMPGLVLGRKDVQEGFASIPLDLVYEGFRKQREDRA